MIFGLVKGLLLSNGNEGLLAALSVLVGTHQVPDSGMAGGSSEACIFWAVART